MALAGVRLHPPPDAAATLPRRCLLAELDASTALLTLLVAPPGYGKTAVLRQWQEQSRERRTPFAWLSLDRVDADPERFARMLLAALAHAGLDVPALPADAHGEALVDAAALAIAATQGTVALVLDDYDRVAHGDVHALLMRLVRHCGRRLRTVVASAGAPALPLAHLWVRGLAERIDAAALAFDADETRRALGPAYDAETAAAVHQLTLGWPVAVRLARAWLDAERADGAPAVMGFAARSEALAAYLDEEVLASLEPALRDLLVETAMLARIDGRLADQIRGRDDSVALLERLAPLRGLLLVDDGAAHGYRHHPLFAVHLRRRFDALPAAMRGRLHRAAATCLGAEGDAASALAHALAAGDESLALALFVDAGGWEVALVRGVASLQALLRPFDRRRVRVLPDLALAQACVHSSLGQFPPAQALLESVRDAADHLPARLQRGYALVVALLRVLMDEVADNPGAVAGLRSQAAAMDADDDVGRGLLLAACAAACTARGAFAEAGDRARDAQEALERRGHAVGVAHALVQQALSRLHRGQTEHARLALAQARHGLAGLPASETSLPAALACIEARLELLRGEPPSAAGALRLEAALLRLEAAAGWVDIYADGFEAAIAMARHRGDPAAALALAERAAALAGSRRLARLAGLAMAWRIDILLDHAAASAHRLIVQADVESEFAHIRAQPQAWRQAHALGRALARWHQSSGRGARALEILDALAPAGRPPETLAEQATAAARALLLQQRGEQHAALALAGSLLDRVAVDGALQVVLGLGAPAKSLLRLVRQHGGGEGAARAAAIRQLLAHPWWAGRQDADFSERELDVLALLAPCRSNKAIARRLNLSENTVKFHLKNLFRKLGAGTRAEAVERGRELGLTQPAPAAADAGRGQANAPRHGLPCRD
ncbi:LuxR C-terminal-related transcriptional regulator [Coralloluteibacterium stylophorae]|uniref:Helix-turn-helix transcriptional regulator n=1 Tax=Coralloluteibacterium stylophorae TaxID=1776034 RepID=A0A8J7VTH9_9GAMM|nr:LuxR C-terminal-related transcriptional regulator [Coralloluteibacterium stylophorae]MBS7456442.1 helix-turn-helix transcriptional regulator [Coralloluteibacterium stylophorae]